MLSNNLLFPPADPLKDFSKGLDHWGIMQAQLATSLDTMHSAAFSNGAPPKSENSIVSDPNRVLPGCLAGGAMIDPSQ